MFFGGQKNFPVVEEQQLVGFLPQQDLVDAQKTAASHTYVKTIMREDIEPVSCNDDLYTVQQRLVRENLGALPVVFNGRFLGLINLQQITDFYRLLTNPTKVVPQNQSV
jgi:predicted transcriptional regulator